MINFVLMNFPVLLCACIVASWWSACGSVLDRILCAFAVYFSWIVIVEELLGIQGNLTLGNILYANLLCVAVIFLLVRLRRPRFGWAAELRLSIQGVSFDAFYFFLCALLIGFALVKIGFNLMNPPLGWDSLGYHFPFAVEWLKKGNLATPLIISDNPCPTYYPLNGSLIYLWFILPFKNVFLADLGQAPFFFAAFLAAYNICRKLGLSKEYSFFAAGLTLVTPNYFKQLSIAYVDVMVSAWFLLALNFALNVSRRFDILSVAAFSLSAGMLLGTKTIALLYCLLLAAFFVFILFKRNYKVVLPVAVFLFLVFLTGSFSYIRNFIQTANPMYPLTLRLFGKVVFSGVMDKANFTSFVDAKDYGLLEILFHEGLGAGATLFIIPGVLLFLFFILFKRKKVNAQEFFLIGSFFYFYAVYRYLFSMPNVRYAYPMVAVGYILSFYAFSKLSIPARWLKWGVLLCFLAAVPEMARRFELVLSLCACVCIFFMVMWRWNFMRSHILALTLSGGIGALLLLWPLNTDYDAHEFERYAMNIKKSGFWPEAVVAWQWLNSHTAGNAIAYIGRPVPFPLYGSNFKNDVFYVSVNDTDPALLHYFPRSYYRWGKDFLSLHKSLEVKENYRGNASYAAWQGNLVRRGAEYLFVYSLHQTKDIEFPLEDAWAKAHTERFVPVFANQTVTIYKIKK